MQKRHSHQYFDTKYTKDSTFFFFFFFLIIMTSHTVQAKKVRWQVEERKQPKEKRKSCLRRLMKWPSPALVVYASAAFAPPASPGTPLVPR